MDRETTGEKRLSAADVSQMAQMLDDGAQPLPPDSNTISGRASAVPEQPSRSGNVTDLPDNEQQVDDDNPLAGQMGEAQAGLYPPDVVPTVEVGGDAEAQAALEHEYRHP